MQTGLVQFIVSTEIDSILQLFKQQIYKLPLENKISSKWKIKMILTLIFSFHFLLLMNRYLRLREGTRTCKKFPWRGALQKRPSSANERSSSRNMMCRKQVEGPVQDIRSKDSENKEDVIPAWVFYICISSASPSHDQLCKLLYRTTSHLYLE